MKKIILINLLLLCISLKAQKPLNGLLIGGDTIKKFPRRAFNLKALAWNGNTTNEYTYHWKTVPQVKDIGGRDIQFFDSDEAPLRTTMFPSTFKVICTIKDANNDSIQLEQVVQTDSSATVLNEFDPRTHVFTGDDYIFDFGSSIPYILANDPYSINITGDGASYVREEEIDGDITYIFNSNTPGDYKLNFNLLFNNEKIFTYTRILNVGDTQKGAVFINKSHGSIDGNGLREHIPIDIQFLEANTSGTVIFSTDLPNSAPSGELQFEVVNHKMTLLDNPDAYFHERDAVDYTLTASFEMNDGRNFVLHKHMTFSGPAEVYTPDFTACKGDTITIPIIYRGITQEMQIQFYDLDILLREELQVIDIFQGKAINVIGPPMIVETYESNLEGYRAFQLTLWNYYYHRNNPADFYKIWNHSIYKNNDTVAYIRVKVLKEGEYTLRAEPIVFNYDDNMPHNTHFGNLTALKPEGESTAINTTKVKGLTNIVKLESQPFSSDFSYTWTHNNTNEYTSNTFVDTREDDQLVTLEIEDQNGCKAFFKDSILKETSDLYSISGILRDENNTPLAGEIIAYQLIDGNYYPSGKDETTDGTYSIENLAAGDYILMGVPDNTDYNAAYYYQEGLRTEANQIAVISDITDVDLVLAQKEATNGKLLEGDFTQDSTTNAHENAFESFHGTLPNIVFLTNENNEIINTATLGTDGSYSIASDVNHTNFTASHGLVTDLLKDEFVVLSTGNDLLLNMDVFPNPFSSQLKVKLPEEAFIKIYDVKGTVVKEMDGSQGLNLLHTTSLKPGFYIISITGQESTVKMGLTKQ